MKALTRPLIFDLLQARLQVGQVVSTCTVFSSSPLYLSRSTIMVAICIGCFFCTAYYFLEQCNTTQDPLRFLVRVQCHLSITACNVQHKLPWRDCMGQSVSRQKNHKGYELQLQ